MLFVIIYFFVSSIINSLYLNIKYFTNIEFKIVDITKKEESNSFTYSPYSGFKNYYLYYDKNKTKVIKADYYYPLGSKLLVKETSYYSRLSKKFHHKKAYIIKYNE